MSRSRAVATVASVVGACTVAVACANGSSLGIEDIRDSDAAGALDPGGPTEISQPVGSLRDASLGTVPLEDGGEAGAAQGTVPIGVDGGGEGGGSSCAAVGPSFVCGLNVQCGCPAGETCDIRDSTSGATSCVAAGASIQGDQCEDTTDCSVGLTCFLGACRPYCTGQTVGAACVGAGLGTCAQATDDGADIPNEEVCFVSCDLTNPSAACGANGCVHSGGETNCETVGFGVDGDPCGDPTDCSPGLACVTITDDDDVSSSTCQSYCQLAPASGTCPAGESCQHFSTDVVLNGTTYGFCQ